MKARIVLGRNLRRLRVAAGKSQEVLALEAGIEPTYVSRLERERKPENPSLEVIEKLADALSTDIRTLFDPAGALTVVKPLRAGRRKAKHVRRTSKIGTR